MYEALLRERMDAEGLQEFDELLEEASLGAEHADAMAKRDEMLAYGGEVSC